MDRDTLEALAVLAWLGEKEKCRWINRNYFLFQCGKEEIPYWLGPLTDNMQTSAWGLALDRARNRYNELLEEENANVQQSETSLGK